MKLLAAIIGLCLFAGCSKSANSDSASVGNNTGTSDQQKQNTAFSLSCYNALMLWKRQFVEKTNADTKIAQFKKAVVAKKPDDKGLVFGVKQSQLQSCTSDAVLSGQAIVLLQDQSAQHACSDGCAGNRQGKDAPVSPEDTVRQNPTTPDAIDTIEAEPTNDNVTPLIFNTVP